MAHYYLVTRLDPSRDIAWIRLGYKKHKDRWFKPDDLAAQKLEADRQKRADMQWKPRLEKLREALESTIETRRLKAEREALPDDRSPRVPMICKTLGNWKRTDAARRRRAALQIEGPAASFWSRRARDRESRRPSPERQAEPSRTAIRAMSSAG